MPPARRKLLDAAMIVLRKKGYAATTVDDLCAAAGVAKGSFFHHFASKDLLLDALVDRAAQMPDAPVQDVAARLVEARGGAP